MQNLKIQSAVHLFGHWAPGDELVLRVGGEDSAPIWTKSIKTSEGIQNDNSCFNATGLNVAFDVETSLFGNQNSVEITFQAKFAENTNNDKFFGINRLKVSAETTQ